MAVRIGIPVPTTSDREYNQRSSPQYAEAVRRAGGEVVSLLPEIGVAQLNRLASTCDGFVLPGSPADVSPVLYGQEADPSTVAPDPAREQCDLLLLEHAAATGKPVLAICYGLQRMNVWRGGSLVQDVTPLPVNHAARAGVAVAHTVLIARESLLASLLSGTEAPAEDEFRKLSVNSSHHQAVGVPGDNLAVVARCGQDGVIEALEGRIEESVMLGVQWHPERSMDLSGASRSLFLWLTSEAEDWQGRGTGEDTDGAPL